MRIRFLEDADNEFRASIQFYEDRVQGLGIEFYEEVRKALAVIQASPWVWPIKRYKCRRYLVKRFPFSIHYFVKDNIIWIVALAHSSRRPFYWEARLK